MKFKIVIYICLLVAIFEGTKGQNENRNEKVININTQSPTLDNATSIVVKENLSSFLSPDTQLKDTSTESITIINNLANNGDGDKKKNGENTTEQITTEKHSLPSNYNNATGPTTNRTAYKSAIIAEFNLRQVKSGKIDLIYPSGSHRIEQFFFPELTPPPLKTKVKNTSGTSTKTPSSNKKIVNITHATKNNQEISSILNCNNRRALEDQAITENSTRVTTEHKEHVTKLYNFRRNNKVIKATQSALAPNTNKADTKDIKNTFLKLFSSNMFKHDGDFFPLTPPPLLTKKITHVQAKQNITSISKNSATEVKEPLAEIIENTPENKSSLAPLKPELTQISNIQDKTTLRFTKSLINNDINITDVNQSGNETNSVTIFPVEIRKRVDDSVKVVTNIECSQPFREIVEENSQMSINGKPKQNDESDTLKPSLLTDDSLMNDEPVPETTDKNEPSIDEIISKIKIIISQEMAAYENSNQSDTDPIKYEEKQYEPEFPESSDAGISEKVNNVVEKVKSIIGEEKINSLDSRNDTFNDIPNRRKNRNMDMPKLNPDSPFLGPLLFSKNDTTNNTAFATTNYLLNPGNPFLMQDELTGLISAINPNMKTENPNISALLQYLRTFLSNSSENGGPDLRFASKSNESLPEVPVTSVADNDLNIKTKNFTLGTYKINPENPFFTSHLSLNNEHKNYADSVNKNYVINAGNPFLKQDETTGEVSTRINNLTETNTSEATSKTWNKQSGLPVEEKVTSNSLIKDSINNIVPAIDDKSKLKIVSAKQHLGTSTNREKDTQDYLSNVLYLINPENQFLLQNNFTGEITILEAKLTKVNQDNPFLLQYLKTYLNTTNSDDKTRKTRRKRATALDGNNLQYEPIEFLEKFASNLLPNGSLKSNSTKSDINSLNEQEKLAIMEILPEEYIQLIPELNKLYKKYKTTPNESTKIENTKSTQDLTFDDIKSAIETNFDKILENGNIQRQNKTKDSVLYKIYGLGDFNILPNKNGLELNILGNKINLAKDSVKSKNGVPPLLYVSPKALLDNVPSINNNLEIGTRTKIDLNKNVPISEGVNQKLDTEIVLENSELFSKNAPESRNPYVNPAINTEKEMLQQYFVWQKYRNADTQTDSEWIHLGQKIDGNSEQLFDNRVNGILGLFSSSNNISNASLNRESLFSRFGTTDEEFENRNETGLSMQTLSSRSGNKKFNSNSKPSKVNNRSAVPSTNRRADNINKEDEDLDIENFIRNMSTFPIYWNKYNFAIKNRRTKRETDIDGGEAKSNNLVVHQSESFGERLTDTKNYSRGSVRSNANPDKGRNDSQVHRSNVLEAQRRVEGSRRQLFEQNQNDKREIDQLFRDNLVNAFKQAAGIKKIEAYQDINAHGRNSKEAVPEEPIDDNYEKQIVQITEKPIDISSRKVGETLMNNEIRKEHQKSEIIQPRNQVRGIPKSRSTSRHQIPTVSVPEKESLSIYAIKHSKPIEKLDINFEEVEQNSQQIVEERRHEVRRKPIEFNQPTVVHGNAPVHMDVGEIQYVKRPTSERRRQHINAIKETRRPLKVKEIKPTRKELHQSSRRNQEEIVSLKVEPQHTIRNDPNRSVEDNFDSNPSTKASRTRVNSRVPEFRPLEEQPEEIQNLHRLYLASLQQHNDRVVEQNKQIRRRPSAVQNTHHISNAPHEQQNHEEEMSTQRRFTTTNLRLRPQDTEDGDIRTKIVEDIQKNYEGQNSYDSTLVSAYRQTKPVEEELNNNPGTILEEYKLSGEALASGRKPRLNPSRNRGTATFKIEDLEKELHSRNRRSTDNLSEVERKIKVERQKLIVRTNRGYKRFQMKKQSTSDIAEDNLMVNEQIVTVKPIHKIINRNRGKLVFRKEDHIVELVNIQPTTVNPIDMEIFDYPFEAKKTNTFGLNTKGEVSPGEPIVDTHTRRAPADIITTTEMPEFTSTEYSIGTPKMKLKQLRVRRIYDRTRANL